MSETGEVGGADLLSLELSDLVEAGRGFTRAANLAAVDRLDAVFALVRAAEARDAHDAEVAAAEGRPARPAYERMEPVRLARSHVTTAMCVTAWYAGRLVDTAVQLHTRLPRLNEAVRQGSMDESVIVTLACRLRDVPDELVAAVESVVVASVLAQVRDGDQPSRDALRSRVDRAVEQLDADEMDRQRERAREGRRVSFRPRGQGMASMWAVLTQEEASALECRLRADAEVDDPEEPRTLDQRMADALAGLASNGDPGEPGGAAPRPRSLQITVISSVAAGMPARVEFVRGAYSSFDRLCAEVLAEENGGARFEFVDPTPGAQDHPDEALRYFLSAAMERRIRLRDGTCRHPGCRVPAEDCQIDHVIAFDRLRPELGGPSAEWNLVCLCRGHHLEKTFGRWTYRPGPLGELIVITETGKDYRTYPRGMLALAREDLLAEARNLYFAEGDRVSLSETLPPVGPVHLVGDDGYLANPPGAERLDRARRDAS